ncbi:hypothetical protein DNH61_14225 [Paenibacillus sambharensis]|uniref:Uncharacterized protein n=1 Tax=Paenibacillus sambharensis TaxID=1803190 RepID=A0A2W1LAB5_9BACL|nr:hypothetical protein [Paenibacillus sambharensis]PZD95669.1 hypothetical protein DNH61_14225 [Paenibacillus sambharensis]
MGTGRGKCRPRRKRRLGPVPLRSAAAAMVPFYRAVASSERYARRWSGAIVRADLKRLEKLLKLVSPLAAKQGLGTNGIGYFISFPADEFDALLTNGTTIPPGTVRFTFQTRVHRSIARAVLPFYRKLAASRSYAAALAKAIRLGDNREVAGLVRSLIPTPALKSVAIEDCGIAMLFQYSSSRYPYRNLLVYEML